MPPNQSTKFLLIGPLPPPWGGARVSFQLFWQYLTQNHAAFRHVDLPIRHSRDAEPPGRVNHPKTVRALLRCLPDVRHYQSVIVFGSRSFCFSYGLLFLLAAKLFGKPFYVRFFGGRPMLDLAGKAAFLRAVPLRLLSLSTGLIIETSLGANEFPDFLQKRIRVVPGYRPRAATRSAESVTAVNPTVKFVYVGEISTAKGVDVLLDAFAELAAQPDCDAALHVYGAGSTALIAQLQATPDVHFFGKVENAELRRRLAAYDVFVFPSTYRSEGHPGVLIEAMMAGLPIISSDLPGPGEIIEDQTNGLHVPPGDAQQLCQVMARLARQPALRERLTQGALLRSRRFDVAFVLPELADALGISMNHREESAA